MYGKLGVFDFWTFDTFKVPNSLVLFILGFDVPIYSADYYPLMPWIFLFFVGTFLGRFFKNGTAPKFFKADVLQPIGFIGRHTLIIYLLHQPIIYGAMYLFFEVFKA